MKGRVERWFVVVGGALLVLLLVLWGWTILMGESDSATLSISLFVATENQRLQQGVEQAAVDYNIDLHMITGYKTGEAEKQMEYLSRELRGQTDGVVISPEDTAIMEDFLRSNRIQAPMLVLDNPVDETLASYIGVDNTKVGELLAETVLADTDRDVTLFVPLLPGTAVEQRKEAFVQAVRNAGRRITVYTLYSTEQLTWEVPEQSKTALVFLEESFLSEACRLAPSNARLYGCGFHASLRDALEQDKITALVVWSDYDIGYLALRQLAARIEGEAAVLPEIDIYIANSENMYEAPLAQILFPIA